MTTVALVPAAAALSPLPVHLIMTAQRFARAARKKPSPLPREPQYSRQREQAAIADANVVSRLEKRYCEITHHGVEDASEDVARTPMQFSCNVKSLPRRALELASRNRVIWRRFPAEFGSHPILVSPDSALSFLKPRHAAFDPMLLRFAREFVRTGKVVWDLGANVGIFSLAAAALGGKVLAVEADPWLHQLLQRTVMHPKNSGLDITPLCTAAGNRVGITRLLVAQRGRKASHIESAPGSTQTGGVRYAVTTPMLTLDVISHDFPPPDVLKVDVEGAERMVFEGAEKLFEKKHPVILVEISRKNRDFMLRFLRERKYELYPYDGQTIEESMNILAVPGNNG